MPIANWVALLAIAHRFKFTDAEFRARREVFQRTPPLDPMRQITIAEKCSVPISFIDPVLEDLIRRQEPLREIELLAVSTEMAARLGVARERYVRESSRMLANEKWLQRVASDIVKSVWLTGNASESV
jgi:hypothetical protein